MKMKKVLVLAAAVLFATNALALPIANSKHNLSNASANAIKGTSAEICVYCHTPHGASAAAGGFAPLWNRTGGTGTTAVYNTGTLDAVITIGTLNNSDAPLCLSCHDGASLTGALNNPPNAGGTNPIANIAAGLETNLELDLSNDHPVGFNFSAANAADAEIQTPALAATKVKVNFGAGNAMWCSSCHDVHNNAVVPFLATSNAGSALCLQCHIK
jgi:predicted CXXCH cytochrome family protein